MAIQVRELVIRAVISDENDPVSPRNGRASLPEADREKLVRECVEQVVKIMQKNQKR
jgi:hypothetical protein